METHPVKFNDPRTISVLINEQEPEQRITLRWNEEFDQIVVVYKAPNTPEVEVRSFVVPDHTSNEALFAMFEEIIVWVHQNFFQKKGPVN